MSVSRTSVMLAALYLQSAAVTARAQDVLPQPDPEFQGTIRETYEDSTPSYPQRKSINESMSGAHPKLP